MHFTDDYVLVPWRTGYYHVVAVAVIWNSINSYTLPLPFTF